MVTKEKAAIKDWGVLKLPSFLYTRTQKVSVSARRWESMEQKQHYPLVAAKQYGNEINSEKFKRGAD